MKASIVVEQVRGRSAIVGAQPAGPLRLLTPRHDGDAAWVYLSSLGGGFVGDDALHLDVEVREGGALFVGSQASSKVYRAANSGFVMNAQLAANSVFVSWQEPVTCFKGAALRQVQRLSMAADASALLVDAYTSGRVERGERWAFSAFSTRLEIDVAGKPWLRDAMLLSDAHANLAARMGGVNAVATVAIVGPRFSDAVTKLGALVAQRPLNDAVVVSANPVSGGLVLRFLAGETESLARALATLLGPHIDGALGDTPVQMGRHQESIKTL